MQAVQKPPVPPAPVSGRSPPLENGDAMRSTEFIRRYEEMPQIKKAELVEGVVYMGSPVRRAHAKPDGLIHGWLGAYAARHPETEYLPNATVILDSDNTHQPDALLRRLPEHGGRTRENEDGYIVGPPELVVEIAASSASIDLRDKLRVYRRSGVLEYLVWRVTERRFDWLQLERDEYLAQEPDADGRLWSRGFDGLHVPLEPLLALDAPAVLAAAQRG